MQINSNNKRAFSHPETIKNEYLEIRFFLEAYIKKYWFKSSIFSSTQGGEITVYGLTETAR